MRIPEAEIEKLMKTLDISREEAIDTWLFDHEEIDNEEADAMTEKAKSIRRYEKSDKERKKSTREHKVDTEKQKLLTYCRIPIEGAGGIVTGIKNEAEFSFDFGENHYTIKLIKHRPKK